MEKARAMSQVSVTIDGTKYRLACNEGEEAQLESLAGLIDEKIGEMRASFGEIGDKRLVIMAALSVADSLTEARDAVAAERKRSEPPTSAPTRSPRASTNSVPDRAGGGAAFGRRGGLTGRQRRHLSDSCVRHGPCPTPRPEDGLVGGLKGRRLAMPRPREPVSDAPLARSRMRRFGGACASGEMRVYARTMKTLLLRGGSDRRAKDDRALRFDPRARRRHARAIQSHEKNRARGNGFPDQARTARGTGPIDGRAQRQGAGTASAGAHGPDGRPARGGGAAHAGRGGGAAARRAPLGGSAAAGRGHIGRRRRRRPADARAQSLIFLARLRVATRHGGDDDDIGAGCSERCRPQRQLAALSLSNPLAAAMAARNLYYGWVVAGATFLVMLATAGAMGAPGVILQPLEKEFGWSTAEISAALAVRLALYGLIAPFAAAFINRFGVRPVVVSAVAMIVAGIVASMAMTEVWQLVALWGVIVGIGTGMVALVLGATVATRWFVHRRGLVVGMLTASNATGQLIFLPLVAKLTETYGWRSALAFVVAMLLVAGFVALLVLRDRPADVGLAPFGERAVQPAPKQDLRLVAMMASPLRALYAARDKPHLLGVVRDLLRLRPLDQRPHPDALGLALRRLRHRAGRGGRRARGDRRLRLRRHDPLGLAVGPLRQPLALCSCITACAAFR